MLFVQIFAVAVHAAEFSAQVISVKDGDTVLVLYDKRRIRIRLAGIDAPEKLQEFGGKSQNSLAELVLR